MGLKKLDYTIENIGNIKKASIVIKPLTVIAGINSSGKTFITKSLYTLLYSVYTNHFTEKLFKEYQEFRNTYREFFYNLKNPSKKDNDMLEFVDSFLHKTILPLYFALEDTKFIEEEHILVSYKEDFKNLEKEILDYFMNKSSIQKYKKVKKEIIQVQKALGKLLDVYQNRRQVLIDTLTENLNTGFKENYQITKLESLCNRASEGKTKLSIDSIGEIEITKKSGLSFSFTGDGIDKVQRVRNIVFFDSPVYLKIRKALDKKKLDTLDFLRFKEDNNYLKGYPDYISKLYQYIDKEYIDNPDFQDISDDIQKVIKGKFKISESRDIHYEDNDKNIIPLSLTAMGISNLGLIDLLLRNNVINKGSFLIMDEPEVHLHPEWQVILAKTLYKIAQSGANVILATHSLDFLKAFQNILKQDGEKAEELISINKMPYTKTFSKKSELEKVRLVLDDLSKPFFDLYMQDI